MDSQFSCTVPQTRYLVSIGDLTLYIRTGYGTNCTSCAQDGRLASFAIFLYPLEDLHLRHTDRTVNWVKMDKKEQNSHPYTFDICYHIQYR